MSECPAYNGIFEYASIRELAHFMLKSIGQSLWMLYYSFLIFLFMHAILWRFPI